LTISIGILFYISGIANLHRKPVDLSAAIADEFSPLEVLLKRFSRQNNRHELALLMPECLQGKAQHALAQKAGIRSFFFPLDSVTEKPVSMRQQRWTLEDDSGCEEWVGAPIAQTVKELDWEEFILLSLENLLVEPVAVKESVELFNQENLEICFSGERVSGANWTIFKSEVLQALHVNHPDIMWARGGLAWAVRKPLYPFKAAIFHCPRVRPFVKHDLRINSIRGQKMFKQVIDESFAGPDFSYKNWLANEAWVEALVEDFPEMLIVEPSALCRADCYSCPQQKLQRKKGLMPLDTFKQLISSLPELSDMRLVFSGMGEPLLNPALADMLKLVKSASTMLITSLQESFPRDFPFPALDQLRISVDALEPEGFAHNRPGCNWKNIEAFIGEAALQKKQQPNNFPELGVSMVRHALNEKNALNFIQYWKKVCQPIFNEWFFRWPFSAAPEKIQWFQVLGENSFLGKNKPTAKIDYTPVKRRPCQHALLSASVLWDGKISACPFATESELLLGDLKSNSLAEIWQSEKARSIRKAHLQLDFAAMPEICASCKDWYNNL
jgi:radical SAM protein with 4Fe4S-binding SPASM domain